MRIGLLGGTFNPIHIGHLYVAEQARTRLGFDQIIFIPTGDPPHKSLETLASAKHRLEMVKLATKDSPQFRVSEVEIFSTEICYTIDTLHKLKNQVEGKLFFIVGLDAFLDLPTWKAADELLAQADFVVVSRPEVWFSQIKRFSTSLPILESDLTALDNKKRDRLEIQASPESTLTLLDLPPCNISASAIRDNLKQGLNMANWLPPLIESYIIRNGLYGVKKGA